MQGAGDCRRLLPANQPPCPIALFLLQGNVTALSSARLGDAKSIPAASGLPGGRAYRPLRGEQRGCQGHERRERHSTAIPLH